MKAKIQFLQAIVILVFLSIPIWGVGEYYHEATDIHFLKPLSWEIKDGSRKNAITMTYADNIATINIKVMEFEEPVTANGLQIQRMTSVYDGWLNKFERVGNAYETAKANMDESYLAVYAKKILDSSLRVNLEVIAEYYYVKENKGYILSIHSMGKYWKEVLNSAKSIIDSFWVGKDRPVVMQPVEVNTEWEMIGKDSQNQAYIPSLLEFTADMQPTWSVDIFISTNNAVEAVRPIIVNDHLFIVIEEGIYSFSLANSKLEWCYNVTGLKSDLLFYDDIVFMIKESPKPVLMGLMAQSGEVLFQKPLLGSLHTIPICNQGQIFIGYEEAIAAYKAETGEQEWITSVAVDVSSLPLVASGRMVFLKKNQQLGLYEDSRLLNLESDVVGPHFFHPAIYQNYVVFCQGDTPNQLHAYDLERKHISWSIKTDDALIVAPFSVGHNMVYVMTQPEDSESLHMRAYQGESGQLVWDQRVTEYYGQCLRPIVSDSVVIVSVYEEGRPYIVALDPLTGAIIRRVEIENEDPGKIIGVRLYKDRMFVFYRVSGKVKLISYAPRT